MTRQLSAVDYYQAQKLRALVAFHYRGVIPQLIRGLKFHQHPEYALPLGQLLGHKAGLDIQADCPGFAQTAQASWLLLPVPLSEQRLAERGYNQAELLGLPLSRRLNVELRTDILFRNRATKRQSETEGISRLMNVSKAFTVNAQVLRQRNVLLLDDVLSSGSTLYSAAQSVLTAGAPQVYCLALASSRRDLARWPPAKN
ncbi:MAG: hypothetical protein PHR21_08150 [Oscillospiraceae bacterium]|nr:hypothetical protein [Oscillospiraceae bacterium]